VPTGGRGKGGPRTKVGDKKEMGGIDFVAVEKEGQIKWEPVDGIDSLASREAARRVEREELEFLRQQEEAIKDARVKEGREAHRKESQRKAQIFGAENVFRTTKERHLPPISLIPHTHTHLGPPPPRHLSSRQTRGPLVQEPKLLVDTRLEEEAARKAGLDKTDPKKYLFLKESLDALEARYKAEELAAREKAYERKKGKLRIRDRPGAAGDEAEDEEVEDLRTRLSKMTDEEFKALAEARRAKAATEVRDAIDISDDGPSNGATPRAGSGKALLGGESGKAPKEKAPKDKASKGKDKDKAGKEKSKGKEKKPKSKVLDPKDDPDYRR
jgi:hypothetical protein